MSSVTYVVSPLSPGYMWAIEVFADGTHGREWAYDHGAWLPVKTNRWVINKLWTDPWFDEVDSVDTPLPDALLTRR